MDELKNSGPVLVTGGAGYIGGQTVLCLKDIGVPVIVIDDLSTGCVSSHLDGVTFYEGSIHDEGLVCEILKRHAVNSILHFAGSIKVDESVADPLKYYSNNTEGSRRLISAAVDCGVQRMIFSSTAAVYGEVSGDGLVSEEVSVAPLNPYGWSKLFTERTLRDVSASDGLQFGILRYFNVAGADPQLRHGQYLKNPVHLIGRAIDAMRGNGGALSVFGNDLPTPDGTGVRDYIHVFDLAMAHLATLNHLIGNPGNLLLNLGYGKGSSVLDVIGCLETVSGNKVPHEFVAARPGEAPTVVANVARLRQTFSWEPAYDNLEVIIQSALDWMTKLSSEKGSG